MFYAIYRYEFLRTNPMELVDGGRELVMKQRGFQLINPTEKWFPGITELKDNFQSWDWRFGKTPAFTVEKKIEFQGESAKGHEIKLKVDIEGGLINEICLIMDSSETIPVVSSFKGQEYNEDNLNAIYQSLKGVTAENVSQAMKNGL